MARPLKIINLKRKLLERIFKDFNATDLHNVAEANSFLAVVARLVYSRKYGNKTLKIRSAGRMLSINNEKDDGSTEVISANAKTFLKHFGECVTRLKLNYAPIIGRDDRTQWRDIESEVFKYCSATLTMIGLKNCRGGEFQTVPGPFENVYIVCILNEFAKTVDIRLSKWFPNTRQFDFRKTAIRHEGCIRTFFRHLQYVEINIVPEKDALTNVLNLLQKNPYIATLYIRSEATTHQTVVSFKLLRFFAETLTRLQQLYLDNVNFEGAETMQHIHFRNVVGFWWKTDKLPQNVSITFDRLNCLELFYVLNDVTWIDFIVQNQRLTALTYIVRKQDKFQHNDFVQFMAKLPNLTVLCIPATVPLLSLVGFLRMCLEFNNLATIEIEYTFKDMACGEYERFEEVIDCELNGAFTCREVLPYQPMRFQKIIVERATSKK